MDPLFLMLATALWLGVLTSISPCPLATNIAAISFISRGVEEPRRVLVTGILYTVGRMLTYLGLGALLVATALSVPQISGFLQSTLNKFLGPLLILVGMFLVGLIGWNFQTSAGGESVQGKLRGWGPVGAVLLGMLFALSFCPVSAALFFGSLIPLSVTHQSSVLAPAVYGIGTALPVFGFAALLALGAQSVGRAFDRLTSFERWGRMATGVAFIGVGVYLTLTHVFGMQLR
ncbi:MAG: sulfite exporter TauE/SafE family protein [Bryobacterales bacterium]|nr:sulfite exporter TauE/SafE family protein [Bryobacterales bacterium]